MARALFRCVAALAMAAFLWTLALSVSPHWHERVHANQSSGDHTCAVTFVSSGTYDHSPLSAVADVGPFAHQFSSAPELVRSGVASPFLISSIFEHGPPVHS